MESIPFQLSEFADRIRVLNHSNHMMSLMKFGAYLKGKYNTRSVPRYHHNHGRWFATGILRVYATTDAIILSLWPNDAIWRHGTRSTLAQVMACCLTAPSHYLNQCWLILSKVQKYSLEVHPSITKVSLKITCLKCYSNVPGSNELSHSRGLLYHMLMNL